MSDTAKDMHMCDILKISIRELALARQSAANARLEYEKANEHLASCEKDYRESLLAMKQYIEDVE